MQTTTDQASDHHALVRQLTELFRDHSKSIEDCLGSYYVVCENHWFLQKDNEVEEQTKALEQGDVIIVLLDTSQSSKIKRLIAFALRNLVIKKLTRALAANGIDNLGSYALYPDLQNVQICYQRQSCAAHYAEEHLLNLGSGTVSRLLNRVLFRLFGTSPLIDVVAVVGIKP